MEEVLQGVLHRGDPTISPEDMGGYIQNRRCYTMLVLMLTTFSRLLITEFYVFLVPCYYAIFSVLIASNPLKNVKIGKVFFFMFPEGQWFKTTSWKYLKCFSTFVWRDDGEVGTGVCLFKIMHINAYPVCGHILACLLKIFNLNLSP